MSGHSLEWSLSKTTLSVDWSSIFEEDNLLYLLYIGTSEGATDFIIGLETYDTSLAFTSEKLTRVCEVFCVIEAASPNGLSKIHRETLIL